MIRILLVDDHHLVRTGLRRILEDANDIEVIGEAQSGEEAIGKTGELHPDVVLMDINMPGQGGLETTKRLISKHPEIKIIALTQHVEAPFPRQFLSSGGHGFLTKASSMDEMVAAVRQVMAGERFVSNDVARKLALERVDGDEDTPFERLSRRELQVVVMLAQGKSVKDISDGLKLSPKTVSTYRARVFDKLSVTSDVELMRVAMQHGVV
jgi:two-component system, NarL family, invasion response regulator UvrY